jgi:hypothetical protein
VWSRRRFALPDQPPWELPTLSEVEDQRIGRRRW